MLVPGRIFGSRNLVKEMDDKVWEQTSNVACLPGIQNASIAMPDAHWGYGFPIGGVAAFDLKEGVISVGGVGFDVNCGVTTLKTNLTRGQVKPKIEALMESLFQVVPAGLGRRGEISLSATQIRRVLIEGARWAVDNGYGTKEDLEFTEERGCVEGADPADVSQMALKREQNQVGTLGSGNHYLEIQYVDEIYDREIAEKLGLEEDQILVSIHCGSRALGHQIGTDYLKTLAEASRKYGIHIRERELVCAPIDSPEGKRYFSAVNCAINYAFANRQVIVHLVRKAFQGVLPGSQLATLYSIGHNTCKMERHSIDGKMTRVLVHRKGATRAFGPHREELPPAYMDVGQPVIIGGTMGTASYILAGTEYGEKQAFASVCHGAGRTMSRTKAKKTWRGDQLVGELKERGIHIKAHSLPGLAEEAPDAYKPVEEVVDAIHNAGLSKKVARMRPLGCLKG
jgi:tRNA-splicing ligase RtcB